MALISCHECGSKISTDAKNCPQCGAKVVKKAGFGSWIVAGTTLIFIVKCTYDVNSSSRHADSAVAAQTPAQQAAAASAAAAVSKQKAAEEARFQRGVLIAKAIKSSLKNPDSFALSSAVVTNDGTYCFEYRATNSFNAVVPNYAVVTQSGKAVQGGADDTAAQWNKHCAHKPNTDITYLRHAM